MRGPILQEPDELPSDLREQWRMAAMACIERTRQRLKEELDIRGNEELDAIWPLINDAVAEFGRDNGYDLILTSPVVYVSGRIDVTDDVLAQLRRQAGNPR